MDGRILTCVYCGHEYPQDTPTHGAGVLTEHIKICERHPMRKAEKDIAMLRAALAEYEKKYPKSIAETRVGPCDCELYHHCPMCAPSLYKNETP